jgi:hypothetical protein
MVGKVLICRRRRRRRVELGHKFGKEITIYFIRA